MGKAPSPLGREDSPGSGGRLATCPVGAAVRTEKSVEAEPGGDSGAEPVGGGEDSEVESEVCLMGIRWLSVIPDPKSSRNPG